MKTIRIALAQIFCLDGDRAGNFARIENALQEAKTAGAELVCFPESCLLGWVNSDAHQRAQPIPGDDSRRLCGLAKRFGVFIGIGLDEKDGDCLYDSAILIDPQGQILLKHRKMNLLAELMEPPYSEGESIQAVDCALSRIGLLICADTFVPEYLQRMKEQKPNLVLVPYGWAAPEGAWPQHGQELKKAVIQAAQAIGAPVIGTDLVGAITQGPWAGRVYGGQSIAASPDGTVLALGKDRDRDLVIVDVEVGG